MKNLPQLDTAPIFELTLNNTQQQATAPEFDALVIDAIESALSILGEPSKQAVYSYLEKSHAVTRNAIPANFAEFTRALENIFGQAAFVLETRIMKNLHCKVQTFKYSPGAEGFSFAGYVEALRDFL
jgi:hypothetical protein